MEERDDIDYRRRDRFRSGSKPRTKPRSPYGTDLTDDLNTRSKLTTREGFLPQVDMRSSWARRFRDAVALHASDMGGFDHLSEGQRALIRRIALIQTELEFSEMKIVQRREHDEEPGGIRLDRYRQMAETLRRLIETLGLHVGRKARDVTPHDANTARIIDDIHSGRYAGSYAGDGS